jgi:hypothetical protein
MITAPQSGGIFGVPLNVSIKYANVAISLTGDDGQRFIYGYVPIVVAKCGVFLKEKGIYRAPRNFPSCLSAYTDCWLSMAATDVEGIFRLNGSAKRIKDLQDIFNSPDRYGKGLDWSGYTVHDAANVFRRYLNQLPEPIVPFDFYDRFREPLRNVRQHTEASGEGEAPAEKPAFNHDEVVATYQRLIKELPPLNRQLLLYILDLLTVFAAKSDINRMTAANLSAIFQPGLLSHPDHYMSPDEYKLSQDVLVFLIENQDNFLFGMSGTAADEQTVKDVEEGFTPQATKSGLRRSASNASAGADSLRKYEAALRRNASVGSKHSRSSVGNAASPTTPKVPRSPVVGVHRSNTVPSKRGSSLSPALYSPDVFSAAAPPRQSLQVSRSPGRTPPHTPIIKTPGAKANSGGEATSNSSEAPESPGSKTGLLQEGPMQDSTPTAPKRPGGARAKDRKLSSLFGLTPPVDDGRQPNRLRKKRIPGSASESAQSSTHSLNAGSDDVPAIPLASPNPTPLPTPATEEPPPATNQPTPSIPKNVEANTSQPQGEACPVETGPVRSRSTSVRSHGSLHEILNEERPEDEPAKMEKPKRRSWIPHRSPRRSEEPMPAGISSNARAQASHSSVGSATLSHDNSSLGNKEPPGTAPSTLATQESSDLSSMGHPLSTSSSREGGPAEKRGLFEKFKAKVSHARESGKDRDGDKSRGKSPPQFDVDKSSSKNSLSIFSGRDSKSMRDASLDSGRADQRHSDTEERPPPPTSAPAPVSAAPPAPSATANNPAPANAHGEPDGVIDSTAPEVVSVLTTVEEESAVTTPMTTDGLIASPAVKDTPAKPLGL